jgi:hypothetical protein
MNEGHKRAYRYLVYQATLDIRMLCQWTSPISFDPRVVWKRYLASRRAGALADLVHNIAASSTNHFAHFDEEHFWEKYERFKQRFPKHRTDYQQEFEDELQRWEEGKPKRDG